MRKIDRLEDMPIWFDLSQYDGCESFEAIDWLTNLESRALIFELLSVGDFEGAKAQAEYGRAQPIDCLRWPGPTIPDGPVKPMSFRDLSVIAYLSPLTEPQNAENWATISGAGNGIFGQDAPIVSAGSFSQPLQVDLRANDSVLIDAFKIWLKNVRSQQGHVSSRERPAYKNWSRYRLLPYLDLLIWSKETGTQVPFRVMVDALDYKKGADSFRKTVPALADSLMRDLSGLRALAVVEANAEGFDL